MLKNIITERYKNEINALKTHVTGMRPVCQKLVYPESQTDKNGLRYMFCTNNTAAFAVTSFILLYLISRLPYQM